MGVLSTFRANAMRPVNTRWLEADRIVSENHGRALLDARESKHALWHADHHVRAIVRLMTLTNKFSWTPSFEDLQEGDEFYLQAIDLVGDETNVRFRATVECLLLGRASNAEVEGHTGIALQTANIIHDVFFDVRDRLEKHLLLQDLIFAPAMMQGGAKTPVDTERIIAYLAGHQIYHADRSGVIDDETVRPIFQRIQQGLMSNQTISALLRRSFGFQSTEGVIEHLQNQIVQSAKENALVNEDADLRQVRNGVQSLLANNLQPQVADQTDAVFTKMTNESVIVTSEKVQGVLK